MQHVGRAHTAAACCSRQAGVIHKSLYVAVTAAQLLSPPPLPCRLPQAVADQSGVEVQPTPHTMRVIQVKAPGRMRRLDLSRQCGH